jgi:hypothetical protein
MGISSSQRIAIRRRIEHLRKKVLDRELVNRQGGAEKKTVRRPLGFNRKDIWLSATFSGCRSLAAKRGDSFRCGPKLDAVANLPVNFFVEAHGFFIDAYS